MRVLILALLVACGAKTHSTGAVPVFRCAECANGDGPLISTHAPLDLWTSWQGRCREEASGSTFGVTSDSGQGLVADPEPCDFVDYKATLACNGASCTITPLRYPPGVNTRRYTVVPTSAGRLQILATLASDGDTKLLEQRFTVAAPNKIVAACAVADGKTTVTVTVSRRDAAFTRGPAQPALRAGDQACTPSGATLPATYRFDCPVPATTVTLTGADFALTSACD